MTVRTYLRRVTLAALLLAACSAGTATAQNPFGGDADPAGTDDGFGAPAAPGGATAAPAGPEETDPVVLSLRRSNPQSPTDLTRAIRQMLNLGRADEARKYLTQLIAAATDATTLVEIHSEYGSGLFLRLMNNEELQPEGTQFGEQVLQAAYDAAREPARLQALVDQLGDADRAVAQRAMNELRKGSDAAIVALIGVLIDPNQQPQHETIKDALIAFRRDAVPPLLALFESPNDAAREEAIDVLGRLRSAAAIPFLMRPYLASDSSIDMKSAAETSLIRTVGTLPTPDDAREYLLKLIDDYRGGRAAGRIDYNDMTEVWRWDDSNNTVKLERLTRRAAAWLAASRLAADLYHLNPDDVPIRRLYLTTLLEFAKNYSGLGVPLATDNPERTTAAAFGPEVIEDVLKYALTNDRPAAATAATEILGEIGDKSLVDSTDGRPRVITMTLLSPHRRVRFAGVQAMRRLDVKTPYAGASFLSETLGYMASSLGVRRALIAHPRTDHAQTLVGMLSAIGIDAETAATGREAFALAYRNPDYEFLLISDAIDRPAAAELLQLLRQSQRTAKLPIGLMARQQNFRRMRDLARDDQLTETFPRPHNIRGVANSVRRLFEAAGVDQPSYDERMLHAITALDYLADLAENWEEYPFYDVLRHENAAVQALNAPALTGHGARALGLFGTASAQRALVDFASETGRPIENRRRAAVAFAGAVRRRGLQLTQPELLLQYDRYNRSAALDAATQQLLGYILDTIEMPTAAVDEAEGSEG